MTLNQLEYALCLRATGSFVKAAEKLRISQPALSAQIKKLEEEIGIKLFNRTSSPIEVTNDGARFLDRSDHILTDAKRLLRFSQELHTSFIGTLKVGVIPTLAPYLVPLFIPSLLKDFPDFRIDIYEYTTEQVISGVRKGSLDVGIISTPLTSPGIRYEVLFYERFYAYSSKDTGNRTNLEINEINYDELWILNEGNCFRDQVNDICNVSKVRETRQFNYRSNSIDALIRIVDQKGGITILPELCLLSLDEVQEERVLPLASGLKAREISLIMTKQYDKERFIDKLQEYIKNNIPKHMLSQGNYEVVDPHI